jgi:predicted 2-oxoglutarate/Fe(II)-dependent dioxygenase YbiX
MITDIVAMLLLLGYYHKINIILDHYQSLYFVVLVAVAKTVFVAATNQRMYLFHIDGKLVDIEGKHNTRVIVISGLLITHFTLLPLYMSVL